MATPRASAAARDGAGRRGAHSRGARVYAVCAGAVGRGGHADSSPPRWAQTELEEVIELMAAKELRLHCELRDVELPFFAA